MSRKVLGLDVGGANLKAAHTAGAARSRPFALWRNPAGLADALQSLLADAHQRGRTIVMSTHQLKEALVLATHVALIRRGEIAYSGVRTQEMVDDTGWLYRTYEEN